MKKFRPKQCPKCKHNKDNFACMNAFEYTLAGDLSCHKYTDWTRFRPDIILNSTNRRCNRFQAILAEVNQE